MDNETRNKIVGKIECLRSYERVSEVIPILIAIVDLIRDESDKLDDKISDIKTDMLFGPGND